jgi:hypothetical protein
MGGALLMIALLGGAGLAGVAIRRRPQRPSPSDLGVSEPLAAAIEAELQEILVEEKLRAESAATRPRTPV